MKEFQNIKIAYCSLGCKVNLYETEAIINKLVDNGATLVDFSNENADVYIINTCSVTNISDQKSKKMVRQAIKRNPNAIIAVMGCSSQLQFDEYKKIEGINILLGTSNRNEMFNLILENLKEKSFDSIYCNYLDNKKYEELKVTNFLDRTRGFIKIQDGCNNFCSYCTIPYARGLIKSRDKDNIIDELSKMTANGIKEIVLTGINTGAYGKDLKDYSFSELLDDICNNVKGLGVLRISSIEATEITKELLDVIKKHESHFCMHLHIPLQGGADATLKRMGRKYDLAYYEEKINLIRSYFPLINITTDVLTGFNGETSEDFASSLKFIEKIGFGELHVFPYSPRPMTVAYKYPDRIDKITKKYRVSELIALNERLALNYRNKFKGTIQEVIIEEIKDGYAYGHTSNYIEVVIKDNGLKENDKVKVRITDVGYPKSKGELYV